MSESRPWCIICGRFGGTGKRADIRTWHQSTHVDQTTPLRWCPDCLTKHHPRLVERYGARVDPARPQEPAERLADVLVKR